MDVDPTRSRIRGRFGNAVGRTQGHVGCARPACRGRSSIASSDGHADRRRRPCTSIAVARRPRCADRHPPALAGRGARSPARCSPCPPREHAVASDPQLPTAGRSRLRSSFNVCGERGSIDILAFHPQATGSLARHRDQVGRSRHAVDARRPRSQGSTRAAMSPRTWLAGRRPCRDSWSCRTIGQLGDASTSTPRHSGRPSRLERASSAGGSRRPDGPITASMFVSDVHQAGTRQRVRSSRRRSGTRRPHARRSTTSSRRHSCQMRADGRPVTGFRD